MIDVKELIEKYSIEELNKSADEYFITASKDALMMKPFNDPGEAPEVLGCFFHVLRGLSLPKGSKILDFGAGSCWSSRIFAAFGYDVVAIDVSPTALDIGAELIETFPVLGDGVGKVGFKLTNGLELDIQDESIDAVVCLSSFHHVSNTSAVLSEFYRVLKPYGVAAFSEPGPNHSKTTQSQKEMEDYTVIENDIDIDDIWMSAKKYSFSSIELGLYYPHAVHLTYNEFNEYINGDGLHKRYTQEMLTLMKERRLFFLEKGEMKNRFDPSNLNASISTSNLNSIELSPGEKKTIELVITNTGSSLWRPSIWPMAPVRVGPSIIDREGKKEYLERIFLPSQYQYRPGVIPGDMFTLESSITAPSISGDYLLSYQLVSEQVKWFGEVLKIKMKVR